MTSVTPAEAFPPGEFLRDELEARGWTESEFAEILGRPVQAISEILNGKKEITADTAVSLGDALGTSAEVWLNLQAAYRLHLVRADRPADSPVARRARLRSLVPVRELQRRGWLPDTANLEVLEPAVCELLGIESPDQEPQLALAARRSNRAISLTPEQLAWAARVKRRGSARVTAPFDAKRLAALAAELAKRVQDPVNLTDIAGWLADCGVALVVELALKNSKIDGVVVFADDGRPIIGLSTRYDRMDSFVFTLLHEIAHLLRGDVQPGDVRVEEDMFERDAADVEAAADDQAARWMFPAGLDLGPGQPGISAILQVAQAAGVHISLVIGRLQHEEDLGWGVFRRYIPKVRPFLTAQLREDQS